MGRTSFYHRTEEGDAIRVAPFCPGLEPGRPGGVVDEPQSVTEYNDAPSEPPADIYEEIDRDG